MRQHGYSNLRGGGGAFRKDKEAKKKEEYMYAKLKRNADFPKGMCILISIFRGMSIFRGVQYQLDFPFGAA